MLPKKLKSFLFAFLPLALYFIPVCTGQDDCIVLDYPSGALTKTFSSYGGINECWMIEVPENRYVRINIGVLNLGSLSDCSQSYLKITTGTKETYTYCHQDNSRQKTITALSDVYITLFHSTNYHRHYGSSSSISFALSYYTEDVICAQKNPFHCSNHTCIPNSEVCDGFEDCANGLDEIGCEKGVLAVKGVNASRELTTAWLLRNRQSVGWGKNTHRAITALCLARPASFRGQNLEEELMAKQLELQTAVALLRNSTDPLSVSELGMYVNALSVTCHDPRRFYGHDLVKVLGERVSGAASSSPGAYLTLCSSNWILAQSDIRSLLQLLQKHSEYPFVLDVQAVTVMALTCVRNSQEQAFAGIPNATGIYDATVEKFITGQLSDGSFGNVYTTALITQALIASGQENNPKWNMTSTIQYLMKQLNSSSVDFLSAYLALPIFSGRSLVDMSNTKCTNFSRKQDESNEISDVTNKLGLKIRVEYSLFIGDEKDVIHTIYLRVPDRSSAYDVMRVAQVADPKYTFQHRNDSGSMYVYEIANIASDPEAGKFWLMYSENSNGTIQHFTESPDKFILEDQERLIMWYKTARI